MAQYYLNNKDTELILIIALLSYPSKIILHQSLRFFVRGKFVGISYSSETRNEQKMQSYLKNIFVVQGGKVTEVSFSSENDTNNLLLPLFEYLQ